VQALLYCWRFWARPNQVAPAGDWHVWLVNAGRGFGKTRTAAEWVRERVDAGARHLILAGATAGDVRDTMVEGESGILAISPPWNRPHYEPSKARLTWKSGARALLLSADEPDRFRGKQSDTVWADELAAWRYPEAWDQLMLGFRLGAAYGVSPQAVVSTTPRPTKIIRELISDALTAVTRGSTYENLANLTPAFIHRIRTKYEGTRLGRQELHAEVLDDAPGALWRRQDIDSKRVQRDDLPKMRVVVVAVDPATTSGPDSDETGIIVVGIDEAGEGYVLDDLSGVYTPNEWGRRVVAVYQKWKARKVVAEGNQGGEMVINTIATVANDLEVSVHIERVHAAVSKRARAEPVAALYEQRRVHHVGVLPELEDELCTWEPAVVLENGTVHVCESPNRLDALVWGLTDLMVDANPKRGRGRSRTLATQLTAYGGNPFAPRGLVKYGR
jgi:phage terminase large subunit-like protein